MPPKVPKLSVDWYKTGGIFNGPSVIGVGEAGKEAVVPLSGAHMKPFAEAIAKNMNGATGGAVQHSFEPVSVNVNITGDNGQLNVDVIARAVEAKIASAISKDSRRLPNRVSFN